jgi:hypothetical protein
MRWAGYVAGVWGWELIHAVISIPEDIRTVGRPVFE